MKLVLSGLLAVVFVAGGPAAVAQTWQFSDTHCVGAAPSTTSSCSGYDTWRTYTDDDGNGNLIRVEGWSASDKENGFPLGKFVQALSSSGGVYDWSGGLGVNNGQTSKTPDNNKDRDKNEGNSPEHAIDNSDRYDFLLVAFEEDWVLDEVEIGWSHKDADLTVLYYDAADAAGTLENTSLDPTHPMFGGGALPNTGSGVLAGQAVAGISDGSSSWKVLNHYGTNGEYTHSVDLQNTNIASSYWLIGAYVDDLSNKGTCVAVAGGACGKGNDRVKIASIVGAAPPSGEEVPEPPTALLLALGVPLLLRLRRN